MFRASFRDFNERNPNRIWRDSLIACLAAFVLFIITVAVDVGVFYGTLWLPRWFSVGGANDARVLLSALLSSVSTVLALMFTVIMLVLSIAATWFGPRLMSRFVRQSRIASRIMGLFLASFVQCVLTMVALRERTDLVWVPQLTILTTITLVVISFFSLVFLCHRIAEVIQISNVLTILIRDLRLVIRDRPATAIIDPAARRIEPATGRAPIPNDVIEAQSAVCERFGAPVHASRSGYLQEIEYVPLFVATHRADAMVRLLFRPGQFVTKGSLLAYVHPAERGLDLARTVDRRHVLGRQRTLKQDLEFGIAEIVEIALRAMSPAINDVYTCIGCVDWLGEALLELALVHPSDGAWTTTSGTIRLLEPPLKYDRFVKAAFNQIRQTATRNQALTIRLFQTFARMMSLLKHESQRQAVQAQVEALWEMVSSVAMAGTDRRDIEAAYALACGGVSRPDNPSAAGAAVVPMSAGSAPR